MTTGQTVFLRKPLPPNIIYAFLVAAPAVVTTKSINVLSPQNPPLTAVLIRAEWGQLVLI